MLVRPYEPDDRAAVRRICYVTGYMGEPVDWQWSDAESFADLFTLYYTDGEPESALVVEIDGEVVGYLLGCEDTRRAWNPAGIIGRHFWRRGLALRPGTAPMVWRALGDGLADGVRRRLPSPVIDPRWPAHLHIDLLHRARGQGVGRALVHRWLESLRAMDVPGCHLETMAENTSAIAFFESMGFRRRGEPARAPGFRTPEGARLHVQLMVQPLGR